MVASRNSKPPELRIPDAVAGVLATAGVRPAQSVCVALSGGVDSTVLLHALACLRGALRFELSAAHVHHGLSPNADAWLEFCRQQCALLDIPHHAFHVEVARDHPGGLEAAARDARHTALAEVRCDWLALGHQLDDQAETLLFRLLRGTGVRGAGAMAPVERGWPGRLRPLLGLWRSDIVAYAEAFGLAWVEDESNEDPRFSRNLIRHQVMPPISRAFPGAVPALARASENFREADGLLGELAAIDRAACGGHPMSLAPLLALSDERVRNLLRWQIREMGLEAPARVRLVEVARQLREAAERPLCLSLGGVACCAYRGQVWLEPEIADDPSAAVQPWRGEAELAWNGGFVRFEPVMGAGLGRAALMAAGEVALCARWKGLSLRQGYGRPSRTFKNLCQEASIPAWLRPRLPVLRVDGRAGWIAEIGVAAELACGPGEEGLLPVWRR
ncbi:MAG TPA: tRNA lysidine(34) synthetase TilS [Aromatoleum sp.]|uniref:tRNA lysidine(34) synthetase TilS n=1 Tax=Aromatoleum sp. TaxID=2307007 RepID=UPI002B4A9ADA|nr:tRNA lysidine(34) synthetase TilS [Aromatoleum sp.]HJV27522.1 tRNA lysidine(34) synthetase TilS [Aromatoleum sp.]